MKHTFALFLLVLMVLGGCGKRTSSNSKKIAKITEQQIQAVMANQAFECASIDGSGCPEGIARLLILNKDDADKSTVCSGFMVNEDTLVTNQHCVSTLAHCKNTYVAIYNGIDYEQTKCKSIVQVLVDYPEANDPRKKLDVAIVKIEAPYYGKTFRPASQRPLTYDYVTAWVMDHTGLDKKEPNLFEARITEFKCRVSFNPGRSALMLERCPIIHGNSGSPVIDESGELIGIVWGGTSNFNSSYDLTARRSLGAEAALTDVQYFKQYL